MMACVCLDLNHWKGLGLNHQKIIRPSLSVCVCVTELGTFGILNFFNNYKLFFAFFIKLI